jgi:CRP-like cAMP-binding protein
VQDSFLYNAGNVGHFIMFVSVGEVKVTLTTDRSSIDPFGVAALKVLIHKQKVRGQLYRAGDHFGEYCLLSQTGLRPETAQALSTTEVYTLSRSDLWNAFLFMPHQERRRFLLELMTRTGHVKHIRHELRESEEIGEGDDRVKNLFRLSNKLLAEVLENAELNIAEDEVNRDTLKLIHGEEMSQRDMMFMFDDIRAPSGSFLEIEGGSHRGSGSGKAEGHRSKGRSKKGGNSFKDTGRPSLAKVAEHASSDDLAGAAASASAVKTGGRSDSDGEDESSSSGSSSEEDDQKVEEADPRGSRSSSAADRLSAGETRGSRSGSAADRLSAGETRGSRSGSAADRRNRTFSSDEDEMAPNAPPGSGSMKFTHLQSPMVASGKQLTVAERRRALQLLQTRAASTEVGLQITHEDSHRGSGRISRISLGLGAGAGAVGSPVAGADGNGNGNTAETATATTPSAASFRGGLEANAPLSLSSKPHPPLSVPQESRRHSFGSPGTHHNPKRIVPGGPGDTGSGDEDGGAGERDYSSEGLRRNRSLPRDITASAPTVTIDLMAFKNAREIEERILGRRRAGSMD